MAGKSDLSENKINLRADKHSPHLEKLLNSQAKLLNIQAEATQSFGKAISNLNTATEELIERIHALPTQDDLIENLGNPIVSEINLLSDQIQLLGEKIESNSTSQDGAYDMQEDISKALHALKEQVKKGQNHQHNKVEERFSEAIHTLRDDIAFITENTQKYNEDSFDKINLQLQSLQNNFSQLKASQKQTLKTANPSTDPEALPELDLGRERLQKVVVGFEIMMRGLGKDIREFRKVIDDVENLENNLAHRNRLTQEEASTKFLTKLSNLEYMIQSLHGEVSNQAEHVTKIKKHVLTLEKKDQQDLSAHKDALQRTSLSFGIMLKNFNEEMQSLQKIALELRAYSDEQDGETGKDIIIHENLNAFSQKLDDIKGLVEFQQTQDSLESNTAQLSYMASHIQKQNSHGRVATQSLAEFSEKGVTRFQVLLQDIKNITDHYRLVVDDIVDVQSNTTGVAEEEHHFDDTVDKINSIVASLNTSQIQNISQNQNGGRKEIAVARPVMPQQAQHDPAQKMLAQIQKLLQEIQQDMQQTYNANKRTLGDYERQVQEQSMKALQQEALEKVMETMAGPMMNAISQQIIGTIERSIQNAQEAIEARITALADQVTTQAHTPPKLQDFYNHQQTPRDEEDYTSSLRKVIDHLR